MFWDPREVQQCTLLSIKTGGCTEDCKYCSQVRRCIWSTRWGPFKYSTWLADTHKLNVFNWGGKRMHPFPSVGALQDAREADAADEGGGGGGGRQARQGKGE
jgi:hypothetical protein